MRNVAVEGAVLMPDNSHSHLQATLLSLWYKTFPGNITSNTRLQSARCEFMLLLPRGVPVFLSTLGSWWLNPWTYTYASAFHASSCCYSGYQFPLSLVSHLPSHGDISDTTEHFGWFWLSMCQPFSSVFTRPNSEASWKVSSLAKSFLLGCNCLLLLPVLRSRAGILLSSFCLDRAGGSV